MKKKVKKSVFFTLLGGLATITALIAMPLATMAAGNQETRTVYHHHTEACNGTVYVEQTCDGTSWLRTVATDTCTVCGAYHDYYQYDGSCSCGKTWYSTGHACINSPEGSNHGTCTNYSVIDCDTTHSHPTTEIVCGKTESTAIGTITVTRSNAEPSQQTVLAASYGGSLQNVSFTWKGSTVGKQLVVTENGTYLLYASYTENGVNYMQEMSVKVDNIDTVAPNIDRLFANITTPVSDSVTLRVYATDDRGFPAKYVSWEGGDFTGNTSYEVTENGTYYVRIRDIAGNTSSTSITVNNIDKEPPVIKELTVSTTEYTSDEIVLNVFADDNMPLPDRYVSWNDGEYTSETHYIADENGLYTVRVRDAAGNFAEETIHINNIDKEPPEIKELKANVTAATAGDVILSVKVQDNTELPIKYVSWNRGAYTSSATYKVSANGTYKVTVKDAAGNISEKSIVVNNIDKEPPVIKELKADITEPTAETVTIYVETEDEGGFPSNYISWNGEEPINKKTFEVDKNGIYEVTIIDKAGNSVTQKIEINNIDKIAPEISSLDATPNPWYTGECNVCVTAKDGDGGTSDYMVSGLAGKAYSWDEGKTWTEDNTHTVAEEGIVTVFVRDVAGNVTKESIEVKKTPLPTVPEKDDGEESSDDTDDADNADDSSSAENGGNNSDGIDDNNTEQKQELPSIPVINLNPSAPDNQEEAESIITPGQFINRDESEDIDEPELFEETTEDEGIYEVEIVEKEEESILTTDVPEEPHTVEQKDSRAFRSLGKILIAILGCTGLLLLGFILFILFGMCRVYSVSTKLKETYLGSVGIRPGKGGFKMKIGNSIWESAESRNLRVKIPGWFVKLYAYKPLQIMVAGENLDKYVESEVDFHLNA